MTCEKCQKTYSHHTPNPIPLIDMKRYNIAPRQKVWHVGITFTLMLGKHGIFLPVKARDTHGIKPLIKKLSSLCQNLWHSAWLKFA